MGPRIDVDTALSSQIADRFTVDDAKLETELVPHFLLPLHLQRRRADDQNGPNPMTQDHLLNNQTGLDGLAQAYIVRNQKVDPRHGECPNDRVELVFINFDTAAKRGLQGPIISLGGGPPTHGVEKGLQAHRMVE